MIDSLGENFTSRLKNGNIEYLKNSKPPKGTFTYEKLIEFKEALEKYPNKIILGSLVEPSDDPSFYAYNLFAYRRIDEKSWEYYFAAIVSVDISSNLYKIENTYLFTEQSSLKSWWKHIFGFYKNETNKDIPKEFVFPYCPPPPFK
ncbi:hypothetical protein WNY78_15360 [Psychroserpens sp. AS72]|uniref:hypothetical protein n=1 Tax=Psychroserpens sp. AS72 TaxID=3135775 RepID=UPI0031732375